MIKIKPVLVLITSIVSASSISTEDPRSKEISSFDKLSKEEKAKNYWENRGGKWSKFDYDGYSGKVNKVKFIKAIGNKKNRKLSLEISKRRQGLLEENLFDTGVTPNHKIDCDKIMKRVHRTPYGNCYFHNYESKLSKRDKDLSNKLRMGAFNERFGRNMNPDDSNKAGKVDIMKTNPLEVSQKLLARKGKQIDAPVINVLATAWLQAMNHDWFSHGKNSKKKSYKVEAHKAHPHFKEGMTVPATRSETEAETKIDSHGYDKTFRNRVTHWWDASQIYGSDLETIKKVRSVWKEGQNTGDLLPNGKIAVDVKNRKLQYDSTGLPVTGFHDNWWTGLELVHVLFHLEHNSIINNHLLPLVKKGKLCKDTSSQECGDVLFEKARMINSALMAKIHTVEWTPALLDNAMLHVGMRSNWFGMREFAGVSTPFFRDRVSGGIKHLVSGLVGKKTLDLYSVPFTLTEEFVSVYRMHPLVPDYVTLRDGLTNKAGEKVSTKDMLFRNAKDIMKKHGSLTWLNSFGTSFPGAMTLNNYPTWMSHFKAERNTGKGPNDTILMDMGAVDILRDRERGILKYNDFRRALKMPPIKSIEELTPNKEHQKAISEVYDGDIEEVDLLIGTLAEADRYPGYAFGNTPFYIFALMASRRLMADPFFSDYFTKEYYTQAGINHVQKTTMGDVITRHFPELKNRFYGKRKFLPGYKKVVKNAFRPWLPVYKSVKEKIQGMSGL